ncbi:hypothetical protein [Variovorax sp.]|uniref:hypothetical protein n=1 Tax=Variovorax sp. TaxID=1871043 RepID=UPI0025F2B97C|nr:hypothetical protein [Variovorax sp.]
MDVAEHALSQRRRGLAVRQHGPVGAGHLALVQRFVPVGGQRLGVGQLRGALQRRRMPVVERLLQRLRDLRVVRGLPHRVVVDVQVAGTLHVGEARHQLAQLGRTQAGADHRAMEVVVEVRQPRAAGRDGLVRLGLGRGAAVDRGIAQRRIRAIDARERGIGGGEKAKRRLLHRRGARRRALAKTTPQYTTQHSESQARGLSPRIPPGSGGRLRPWRRRARALRARPIPRR